MSTESDPSRLSRGGEGTPDTLVRALVGARGRTPSGAVLASVAAKLPSGPPGGGGGPDAGEVSSRSGGRADPGAASSRGGGRADPGAVSSRGGGATSGGGAPIVPPPSMWPGVLVGAALGGVVGVASLFVPMEPSSAPSFAAAPPAATTADPAPSASTAATGTASAPPAASANGNGTASSATSTDSTSAPAASAAPGESEADYLRRAHGQIAAAPGEALALAEAHPQRYPDGKLGQEREMIAIGALAALGRTAEARARAKVFLTLFPESAHRRRLEVLIPDLAQPEKK